LVEIIVDRKRAVHEKRRWVRLTRTCNNHCLFCLDSGIVGEKIRAVDEIRAEIDEGRRDGCERLILSGGEPTLHPDYLDLVAYGAGLGYSWVQTVSNGRMFSYSSFAARAVKSGLCEATFSMHGHEAKLHDRLVGVKGAFDQAIKGMDNLRNLGIVVNVDIVLTGLNAEQLPEIVEYFMQSGVREFDLLWMVPFGSAWRNRHELFLEPESALPRLHEAIRRARAAGAVVWTNRLPPPLLEGHEDLIQDPHKLHDEVRGRLPEYMELISSGEPLRCNQPERCRQCPMEGFCRSLESLLCETAEGGPTSLSVNADCQIESGMKKLLAGSSRLRIHARDQKRLAEFIGSLELDGQALILVLDFIPDSDGLDFIAGLGENVVRMASGVPDVLEAILAGWPGEVEVMLNRATEDWVAERIDFICLQTDRLLFSAEPIATNPAEALRPLARYGIRLLNLPRCLLAGAVSVDETEPVAVEAVMGLAAGELAAFTEHYISHCHRTYSLRCKNCQWCASCKGLPVNMIRAHGFDALCHPST
jgi:pyruvate-formate lyase-activating enzyme